MAYKTRQRLWSIFAAVFCVLLIYSYHFKFRIFTTPHLIDSEVTQGSRLSSVAKSPSPFDVESEKSKFTSAVVSTSTQLLPADISLLIAAGHYQRANKQLLDSASIAVERSDNLALAEALSQLGEVALLQGSMDTAHVYLVEALEFYDQLGDEIAAAGVNLQLGRLHVVARQRARLASSSYDTLLVARWKINHGQFRSIESELRRAAENNLYLNRYSAAASVYETLFKGYIEQGDYLQAQQAGSEAIKNLAASGRRDDAQTLLEQMRNHGFAGTFLSELQAQVGSLGRDYESNARMIAAARDYTVLYNQLQARGDVVSAWRFRQQADRLLGAASARAQYRRQSDVLVELYNSNFSMENAKTSLQQAREVYLRHGMDMQIVENLQREIF